MDTTLMWTVVGSVAGVVGAVATVFVWAAERRTRRSQIRSGRRPEPVAGSEVPRQLHEPASMLVGRDSELADLDRLLLTEGLAGAVVAISGAAGVGKTALARQWVRANADRFPDGVIHVDLKGFGLDVTPVDPAAVLVHQLRALGIPAERIPAGLAQRSELFRELLARRRVLVLLDNARDDQQVRPLLPGSAGSVTIVTSRRTLDGLAMHAGAEQLTLDVLGDADARTLLFGRIGRVDMAIEADLADRLLEQCGGLPIALAIVAARVRRHRGTLIELVYEIEHERLNVLHLSEPEASFRAVMSPSYRALSAPAARLFRLFGASSCFGLDWRGAATLLGTAKAGAQAALSELANLSLMNERTPGRFSAHDLVRDYAAEMAGTRAASTTGAALRRLADHYLRSSLAADRVLNPPRRPIAPVAPSTARWMVDPADYDAARRWFDAEHENIVAMISRFAADGVHEMVWQLAWTLVTYYDRQGRWHEQVATQWLALRAARALDDTKAVASVHRLLGQGYGWLGRHDQAVEHCTTALSLYESLDDRPGCARTHYTLGWEFGERHNEYTVGLHHATRALAIYVDLGDAAWEARTLNSVGWYQAHLQSYDEALRACEKAIRVFRRLTRPDRHGEADTLDGLGYVHHRLGNHRQARQFYEQALALWRDQQNAFYEADTLLHLGDVLLAEGDRPGAENLLQEALAILEKIGHPEAVAVRDKLTALR
jgi:tetratricopeptide (TPR) repeat protein